MKVIGLAAQMQNGKDTAADYLKEKLPSVFGEDFTRTAFAASVKRVYSETFNVPLSFIEEWKVKPECPPGFDMNVRQGLQFIGDGFRKIQGNIWIELAFRNRTDNIILSDARYINELKKIKSLDGLTILVWRPGFENNDPNGSESQIKPVVDWFKACHEAYGIEGPINDLFKESETADELTGDWSSGHPLRPRYWNAATDPRANIPEGCQYVDLFLVNEGTKEDFYAKIDKIVVPYVQRKWFPSAAA